MYFLQSFSLPVCTAISDWEAAIPYKHKTRPATEGMVEVTYRFDDQPLSREQWEYNGYQVFSYESVDQVLDGISSANQVVFQVGSGTTTEIKLAGFGGADGRRAVTTFLQRCKPSTE